MQKANAIKGTGESSETQPGYPETFSLTLSRHGLNLERGETTTLQVNIGLLCNQSCKHCHLEAGPNRSELMDDDTLKAVLAFAQNHRFNTIDITGGATELHPDLIFMIEELAAWTDRIMVRSNLSALLDGNTDRLIGAFKAHGVVVVASFPSFSPGQLESQRGKGAFEKSIAALRKLNAAGYGKQGGGFELNLVSNPAGAFLPPPQAQAETRFREYLQKKWGISFTSLFTFANVPLGRFRQWLYATGNLADYLARLRSHFNPCVVEGLMCRSLMSVAWDGYVYDCDFNLATGLPLAGCKTHISDMDGPPGPGTPIAVADHCYTCTAGLGFT